MLELKSRLPLNTMTGEIIAREWGGWVRSLTVNRGRADDVKRLTAVISPDGLVGRVVDVRPGAAVVQVLTDPTSTVGAHAVRTRTPGVVEGEPRGTIRFKYMARDGSALQPGDLVVTSGLGGLFPRGIPVGRVRAIDDRGSALFSFATLEPAVNFAKIDEVLLVTGDRMEDVTAYFPTGGGLRVTQPLVQVTGLVVLSIVEGILRFGILKIFHFPAPFGELMAYVVLPQALYNGFLGAALVLALAWADAQRHPAA